ncbi:MULTISPECIES: alpha/beta fold hydrolase [Rhodococcus]|uniref:Alpha/beta fold hydrolase n=1 Tax=Rhodococcus aetherivorans TaxID=191292 RepID=A0AA46P3R9_9NOCA|nr:MULTISPECIES: alpha/beta fold hydrolase [Rhodococcus]ANZ24374.1 lipase [Rhodococcus sp. WB1]QRI78444.1 alpha/beta fold hydrolase [Rhodococcus aetherivorans]QSE61860.1 alpha/beta fold hydrolase [Rhodococcus sp. PSBB066]QSE66831.1 alpha/beta fold hydrolase [Rhodococcus sp. PSBB049]UYF96133.1 alpha/beta fold hydrolase [Rhodococcus aetherivorans]
MKYARRITVAVMAAALTAAGPALPTAAADTTDAASLPALLESMGPSPAGANNLDCVPSPEHPRPVVLVHGTRMDMTSSWAVAAPQLADLGYCVYALNYGGIRSLVDPGLMIWGVGSIEESAKQLGEFVDAVRAHTGADRVDLVGHSQGGPVSRQYLRFEGGADPADPARNEVDKLVMLGATNHGTTFNGMQQLYSLFARLGLGNQEWATERVAQMVFGIAGRQQLIGSRVLARLNSGTETLPGIDYTSIATRQDTVATPPENAFLQPGADSVVHNVWVEDVCPTSPADHLALLELPESLHLVKSALDPHYAETVPAPCTAPPAG